MELSYGDIELLLRCMHQVHEDKRIALVGRIKHFQRLGWPEGTNVGKGSRVKYNTRQTLSLVAAFELVQCGLPPERAIYLLKSSSLFLPMGFLAAIARDGVSTGPSSDDILGGSQPDEHVFFCFDVNALRSLTWFEGDDCEWVLSITTQSKLSGVIADHETPHRRVTLLNMTMLIEEVFYQLQRAGEVDRQQVRDDLRVWRDAVIEGSQHGNYQKA